MQLATILFRGLPAYLADKVKSLGKLTQSLPENFLLGGSGLQLYTNSSLHSTNILSIYAEISEGG